MGRYSGPQPGTKGRNRSGNTTNKGIARQTRAAKRREAEDRAKSTASEGGENQA